MKKLSMLTGLLAAALTAAGAPFTIAHTGCEGTKMNSLESVRVAIEAGVDIAEFDLNVNSAGELVISHDRPKGGEPTVDAALAEVAKSPKLRINIDCKNKSRLEKLPALIAKHGLEKRFFLTGIGEKKVAVVRAKYPGAPYLVSAAFDLNKPNRKQRAEELAERVKKLGGIGICIHFRMACEEIVEAAHKRGLVVSVWTPGKESEITPLIKMGCDYITSRNARLLRRLVK